MTAEQQVQLQASKLQLLHFAVLYALTAIEYEDIAKVHAAELRLCNAARTFTRTVDSIDPKLWEPDY